MPSLLLVALAAGWAPSLQAAGAGGPEPLGQGERAPAPRAAEKSPPPVFTYTVTNNNDAGPGSLREILALARSGDTIGFAPAVTGKIILSNGQLLLTYDVNLIGPGPASLAIDGINTNRIFDVSLLSPGRVIISGLTLTNGRASVGGAVLVSSGDLSLSNCVLTANHSSPGSGGALLAANNVHLTDCTFSNNTAAASGGAIAGVGLDLALANCTFNGNWATNNAGGALSVALGNVAATNSTFSGNRTGGEGGAIAAEALADVFLLNCTLADNAGRQGGGISAMTGVSLQVKNTVLAGNSAAAGPDCLGSLFSGGHNLIQNTNGCAITGTTTGNIYNMPPGLGPLADNGGLTFTRALLAGSPALDAGDGAGAPAIDQRGVPRPQGGAVDIGAFEGWLISCSTNIVVRNDPDQCGAAVVFTNALTGFPTPDMTCRTGSTVITSPHFFPLGTNTVTCVASNGLGTDACSFSVTVLDLEPPAIVIAGLTNILADADGGQCSRSNVTWLANASDNCGSVTIVCEPPSASTFLVGTTPVNCVATDDSGNTNSHQFTVTIRDTEPPLIVCASNVVLATDSASCTASSAGLAGPALSDNCGIVYVISDAPPALPLGTNRIRWTAFDLNGNRTVCTQEVAVIDTIPPLVSCVSQVLSVDAGQCTASSSRLVAPVFADNCGVALVTNDAPLLLSAGESFIRWSGTDLSGNTASCTQQVTVVSRPCPITCPGPLSLATDPGQCSKSNVTYTAAPNCTNGTVVCVPPSGSTFDLGASAVVCTATNCAGDIDSCNFLVTVSDAEPPRVSCTNTVLSTDEEQCTASRSRLPIPEFSDNCGIALVTNDAPSILSRGTNLIQWRITDLSGNSITCTQQVLVRDMEPPSLLACPSSIIASNGPCPCGQRSVTYNTPVAADNCTIATVSCVPPSGSTFGLGVSTVVCTAIDSAGNSNVCSFPITNLDQDPPLLACPTNILVATTGSGSDTSSPVDYLIAASDNCMIVRVSCVPTNGSTFPRGTNVVSCTASDDAGNSTNCMFTVTVVSPRPPTITSPLVPQTLFEGCTAVLSVAAKGPPAPVYEWYWNGLLVDGATNNALVLPNLRLKDAGTYRVRVSNSRGARNSEAALMVLSNTQPVQIVTSPNSRSAGTNTRVTFSVVASSTTACTFYQWRLNGVNLTNRLARNDAGEGLTRRSALRGADSSVLVLSNVQPADAGAYSVVVGNGVTNVESRPALLVLTNLPLAPRSVSPGTVVKNSPGMIATNTNSFRFTWKAPAKGVAIFTTAGSSFDTKLSVTRGANVMQDDDRGGYATSLLRFNAAGGANYDIAITGSGPAATNLLVSWRLVTNAVLPIITTQPKSFRVVEGMNVTFTVEATNPPGETSPLHYQWCTNDTEFCGETQETLARFHVQCSEVARYCVRVSNEKSAGLYVESEPAFLELADRPGDPGPPFFKDKFEQLFADVAPSVPSGGFANLAAPAPQAVGSFSGGFYVGNNFGGSTKQLETNCYHPGWHTKWFVLTNDINGVVLLDSYGGDLDTVLTVYTNKPGAPFALTNLVQIKCDQSSGPGRKSAVWFVAKAGVPLIGAVDSVTNTTACFRVNYALNIPQFRWVSLDPRSTGNLIVHHQASGISRMLAVQAGTNYIDLRAVAFQGDTDRSSFVVSSTNRDYVVAVEPLENFTGELTSELNVGLQMSFSGTSPNRRLTLTWAGEGHGLFLQSSPGLMYPAWRVLAPVVTDGQKHTWVTNAPPTGSGFYRISAPPR